MSEYRVTLSRQDYIEFDVDELKDVFPDEWSDVLLRNGDEEEFIDYLLEEYGFQYFVDEELFGSLREDEVYIDIQKL